jgi:hypothetical protein
VGAPFADDLEPRRTAEERAAHFRARAEGMRRKAMTWPPGRSRDVFLEVAESWDKLANLENPKPLEAKE